MSNMSIEGDIQVWRNEAGHRHREDGPAFINKNGYESWFLNGKRHREDGPARIHPNGARTWWVNGKYHREDGPAMIRPDGYQAWYIAGIIISDSVDEWIAETAINPDYTKWTDKEKMWFKLRFCGN